MTDEPALRAVLAPLLSPVVRGLESITRALRALDRHVQQEAGAQKERDEQAEELCKAVADALDALPAKIEEAVAAGVARALAERRLSPVEQAREDLAVEVIRTPIGMLSALKAAPRRVAAWLAADKVRAGAVLVALGGLLLQLADGAPFLATLGRALMAVGGIPSAGGATP